jgi:hypothetical protein
MLCAYYFLCNGRSVHSTTHPDPRDATTPIAAKELADDGPAAAGEADFFRVAKRYGKLTELLPELSEPFDRRKAALAKGQISTSPQLFKPGRKTSTAAKIG